MRLYISDRYSFFLRTNSSNSEITSIILFTNNIESWLIGIGCFLWLCSISKVSFNSCLHSRYIIENGTNFEVYSSNSSSSGSEEKRVIKIILKIEYICVWKYKCYISSKPKSIVFKIYYYTLSNILYTIRKCNYISYTIIIVYKKETKKSCGIWEI